MVVRGTTAQGHLGLPSRAVLYVSTGEYDEREAIAWAREGLVRIRDVLEGTRLQSDATFHGRHTALDRPDLRPTCVRHCHRSGPQHCGMAPPAHRMSSACQGACWTMRDRDSSTRSHVLTRLWSVRWRPSAGCE